MRTETLFAAPGNDPFDFVVSTGATNRKGFRIDQRGWQLDEFRSNPIALWMHDPNTPIGTWDNIRVQGGKLMATLRLAARGTSDFIDVLHRLIEQNILRATSVGFRIKNSATDPKTKDLTVTEAELREISLVSVPADANALRAVNLSDDMRDRIISRKPLGEAAKKTHTENTKMPKLSDRIAAKELELIELRDKITELSAKEELEDADATMLDELTEQATALEKNITSLRKAEVALALGAKTAKGTTPAEAKKVRKPAELLFRSAYVIAKAHVGNRSLEEIILSDFGGDRELTAVTLAATNPAMTTVQGWAAELIDSQIGEFLDLLRPESIWARLTGLRIVFDRTGTVRLPGRTTRDLAGSFVGEGAPIPVKQAMLTSILVTPFKMGVITTMTRELAQRSAPAAEPLFRSMMVEDTAVAIDSAFMDTSVATAVRPAGLQILGTGAAAPGGDTVSDIIAALKGMVTDMVLASAGRRPVWIMNEITRITLATKTSTTEDSFPFAAEVNQGRLMGFPIMSSITVPPDVVFLLDQGEFVQGYGDSPAIDMSNQATLHMESVAPLPLNAGAPANPMRSLFQTDSLGLRLVWDISWNLRRPGACQFRTGVSW